MVELKKRYWTSGAILLLLILAVIFLFLRSPEDYWIKYSRGVWIKHGSPLKLPDYVLAQQQSIVCASNLYKRSSFENLSSPCLGSCDIYGIYIVHVPRTEEDDKVENQCEAFRRGQLTHFIELDKDGNIVRIV